MLPSGEILKTGLAAIPMVDRPYFPFGTNPSYLNKIWFGSQGTLGIVTKAVVKLKTDFACKRVFFVPFNAFHESLNVIREMKRLDYAVELFLTNPVYFARLFADGVDEQKLRELLPPVISVVVLRGEDAEVEYQMKDLAELSEKMGFRLLDELPYFSNASESILRELDYPEGYRRMRSIEGGYSVIPFICTATQLPMFAMVLSQIAGAFGYDVKRVGQVLLPVEPGRVHFQYSFFYNPQDPKDIGIARTMFDILSSTIIKMGGFFSRPYGTWADLVFAKAGAYKSLIKEIKRQLDPEAIMNPGKLNL
jgi:FAD/FMN-containing dehydrogenase